MHKTDGFLMTSLYAFGVGIVFAIVAFILFIYLEADSATDTHKVYQEEKNLRGDTIYRKNTVMRGGFDENVPAVAAMVSFCVGIILIYLLRYVPFFPSVENLLDMWAGVEKK
jgi:hypothetical protein